ncbi:hypothetical protein SAMN05443999_1095 [Roseovarius azorensis]|uniref:Uncharacterized protein n=1 Tax=Roseovarius azorensis TaxID=1287727 RepID=A0A1H7TPU9_9RHOB|nr:hypothetical protein [Roseovarius azorensis]SEL86771.1 hypothetical protein SAMN05443999_1095 [Roseovarius azorensis]
MFKISQASVAFAEIDQLPDDDFNTLDKELRNLTQRTSIAPRERDGRADLFDEAGVCALRLVHIAKRFGFDRFQLDRLARFLLSADTLPGRYRSFEGGRRALSVIEEAIERTREGEVFDLSLVMYRDGTIAVRAGWADTTTPEAEEMLAALEAASGKRLIDAAFVLPVSRLIAEVLGKLPKAI